MRYVKLLENSVDQSDLFIRANTGLDFQKQKNFIEAKKIFQELILEFSDHYYPRHLLGNLFIEMDEINKAQENLEISLSLNKDIVDNYINLSFIHFKNKNYFWMEKILKDGVKIDNKNLELKLNLSELYLIQGKLKEVIEIDKNIIRIYPDNYYVLNRLDDLGEQVLDKGLKKSLKQSIKKENLSSQKLIYANFLLSKYENKLDKHKQEFEYLSKAHELVFNSNKVYFTQNNSFIFERLKDIQNYYDNDLKVNIPKSNKNIRPIFIFGLPRSGSTLIEKIILKGTSDFIPGEETRIFNSLVDNIFFKKDKDFIPKCLEQINDSYLDLIKSGKNVVSFTDKSLNNFFFLGWIKKLFPDAKFINCKRDPYVIISSIFRNNLKNLTWAHNIDEIVHYIDIYNHVSNRWLNEFNVDYYEINYSQLVNDFETETKKLFEYCEIDWNADLINFNTKNFISHTASNIKIRSNFSNSEDKKHSGFSKFLLEKINRSNL